MRPSRLWVGTVGLLALVAPRVVLALHSKVNLLGFRNTEDVEPADWLVSVTRIAGFLALGVALFGPESEVENTDGSEGIDYV